MLVLDASVLLNLLGSCRPRFLLKHLPFEAAIPAAVAYEIKHEPQIEAETDASFVELVEAGSLRIIEPSNEVERIALSLAGSPTPNDLDDGEAYAIAQAAVMDAVLGIDERKGRRIVAEEFPNLTCMFTIEIIERAAMRANMGEAELGEIIYSALRWSRMRIPSDRRDWIISLIGKERARNCPSLGYVFL
jgi:predicted nucleic acid-binding protein